MTMLRTNLGNTRPSAQNISFSPVSGNAHTNVQDAIVGIGGSGNTPDQRTVSAAGTVTVLSTDVTVLLNKTDAATVNLPTSASWLALWGDSGLPLFIKDISGAIVANVATQTITPDGAETIDGLASVAITNDYQGFNLFPVSGSGWTIK